MERQQLFPRAQYVKESRAAVFKGKDKQVISGNLFN